MRPSPILLSLAICIAGMGLTQTAAGQSQASTPSLAPSLATSSASKDAPPAEERPQDPANTSPEWLDKQNNLGSAVLAPLDDLNLRRLQIPEILIQAIHAPYDIGGLNDCAALAAEVGRLDDALGPDIDTPRTADERNLTQKGQDMADKSAVGAVRDASTGFIPFRGMVRKLTGAERHQREVEAAIEAGQSRRAFLKGAGMIRNCAPPAAPYGFAPKKATPAPARSKATKKR